MSISPGKAACVFFLAAIIWPRYNALYSASTPAHTVGAPTSTWLILTGAGGLSPAPPAGCPALKVSTDTTRKPRAAGRYCAGVCAGTATAIL